MLIYYKYIIVMILRTGYCWKKYGIMVTMRNVLFGFLQPFIHQPLLLGLIGGIIITAFNTFGAFFILFAGKTVSQKLLDVSLGFAAGLMLAASFTSLLLPAIKIAGIWPALIGVAAGALFFDFTTNTIPHSHGIKEGTLSGKKRIMALWLFILAITIHNIPEGLSVGIALGGGKLKEAIVLMLAIGIQNVPEGFAVGFSYFAHGLGSRWQAVWMGTKSGLIEIPLAIVGALLVSQVHAILPYAMGFGAGAMLYVISNEIIPETHKWGHERLATIGTIAGIILMIALDAGLG